MKKLMIFIHYICLILLINLYNHMMKFGCILLCFATFSVAGAQPYQKLHTDAVVTDSHNDILSTCIEKGYRLDDNLKGKTHSDLNRMISSGVDVQVFSIWCDGSYGKGKAYAMAKREIDTLYAAAARNPAKMKIVKNEKDLANALAHKQLAAMMGVEGGHMIEDNMAYLDSFRNLGVCYMTLTWNNSTTWATSAKDEARKTALPQAKGLNEFGKNVVRRMNAMGMMVDVSHIGEQTFWDVMKVTTKPVIASHSNAYALCPVPRNLKDSQIRAIAKNGGVIDVNFYPGFVDSNFEKRDSFFNAKHKAERDSLLKINPETYYASNYLAAKYKSEIDAMRPPLSLLINHIDYLVKVAGIDHVGLGGDLDGISITPKEIDDITDYPVITRELLKRGYSQGDIRKILGENFLRVYKANQP